MYSARAIFSFGHHDGRGRRLRCFPAGQAGGGGMAAMIRGRLSSRPGIGVLLAAGAALVAAFVFVPAALLTGPDGAFRDEPALRDAVGRGLAEYWRDGGPRFPALLATLVDHWFRWHAIKVVISASMVAVFALLAVALWRRYLHGPAGHAAGAIGATVFTVVATGLLVLNVQATAVPLVALLPLLPAEAPGLHEMRAGSTGAAGPYAASPASAVLLGEVGRYHWIMAAMAATLMTVAGVAAVSLWGRRAAGGGRASFMRRALSVVAALTAGLFLLVTVASVFSAVHPAGTLRAVLGSG